MHLKLFTKFVLLLVLLAVIPAAIVGLRTININREGMQASILELHTHTASYLADYAQNYLQVIDREIQYILQTLLISSDSQAVLQALLDSNENFASVSIVSTASSTKGEERLKVYNPSLEKDAKLLSRKTDTTFEKFLQNPKNSSISQVYFIDGCPMLNIIYPINQNNCLYAVVSLAKLWDQITQTRIASTGYAFMVNENGDIIAHPKTDFIKNKTNALNLPIVKQVLQAVAVGSSEYIHPLTKKAIVGAYAPVKALKWGIIIQQDKSEAFISVNRMKKQAAALILISVAFAGIIAFFIARGLTKPLVKITLAAQKIANKDFTTRVTVNTHDELHDLAETFNDMTRELERYDKMQVDKIVEEKTKTEAVIFSISDGIIMTDSNGRLQLANKNAKELLNIPEKDWQNNILSDFIKNENMKSAFTEIIEKIKNNIEVDLSANNIPSYYILKTEDVISPQNQEKIGIVTVLRNITLEKELDKMKDDFLHSITHDLRNPMTSIRGFLKFLNDGVAGPLTPQQKKMMETMDRASLKLLGLINDILDIAKLESGRLEINLAETDIKAIAQKSIDVAEGIALKKNIKLTIDSDKAIPLIKCDPELVERVFTNLLSNALKFTPENGLVAVKIEVHEDLFQISIIDTGEGIPPEYINKIFDKFQQVKGQRKGGTGLGLTICKHIVEAHHGKIWVESNYQQGAKFIFTLSRNLSQEIVVNQGVPEKQTNETKK